MVAPSALAADNTTGAAVSGVTVGVATLLTTVPCAFDASTRNRAPLSALVTLESVTLELENGVAASGMFTNVPPPESRCHCKVLGAAPVTDAVNVTGKPSGTVTLVGWRVKTIGALGLLGGAAPFLIATSMARRKISSPVEVRFSLPA